MKETKYAQSGMTAIPTRSAAIASGTLRMALPQSKATTKSELLTLLCVDSSTSSFPPAVVSALQRSSQTKLQSTRPVISHACGLPGRRMVPGYVPGSKDLDGYPAGPVGSCGGAEKERSSGESGGGRGGERRGSGEVRHNGIFDENDGTERVLWLS